MSTVIWHEGVMYADTQGTVEEAVINGIEVATKTIRTVKIFKENGKLYGATGEIGGWWNFQDRKKKDIFRWCLKEMNTALIMEWDGKNLFEWKFHQTNLLGIYFSKFKKRKLTPKNWAVMGSGDDFAIEALDLGLDPIEAIEYASRRDPWTNDKIMTLTL